MRSWTPKSCTKEAIEDFDRILDLEETAIISGHSVDTLRLAILEGHLAAVRFIRGKESFYLLHEADLADWIASGLAPDPSEAEAWRAAAALRKIQLPRMKALQEMRKRNSALYSSAMKTCRRLFRWLGLDQSEMPKGKRKPRQQLFPE